MAKKDSEQPGTDDDYEYEGFCIDIIKNISERLKFKPRFHEVGDGKYGNKDDKGEWNGIIRELMDHVGFSFISCEN